MYTWQRTRRVEEVGAEAAELVVMAVTVEATVVMGVLVEAAGVPVVDCRLAPHQSN